MSDIVPTNIDPIIHGRMRLGIMVYLADAGAASFSELKTVLGATQGNLSAGLSQLEAAAYIKVEKDFVEKRPRTLARVTTTGRRALANYLQGMAQLAERLAQPKS